jgi:hypothetical protein
MRNINIKIQVDDEETGEMIGRALVKSVDSAIQELMKIEKKIDNEDAMLVSELEEEMSEKEYEEQERSSHLHKV